MNVLVFDVIKYWNELLNKNIWFAIEISVHQLLPSLVIIILLYINVVAKILAQP